MHKEALIGVGAGLLSALLWASIASQVPGGLLLAYLAPLPLMAVGLGVGSRATAFASGAGVMVAVIAGNGFFAAVFALAVALPAFAVTRQALMHRNAPGGRTEWYPAGDIIARLAVLGAGLVGAAGIIHFDVEGGLRGALAGYLDPLLQARFELAAETDRAVLIQRLLPWLPAAVTASWILQLTVNAALAQGLLTRAGRNLRPSPSYVDIDIPEWLYWATVATAALALVASGSTEYVARNMVMVLAVPFFFVGLGTVHVAVRRLTMPGMALALFYLLLFFFGWTAVAVAGIGFFEQWAGLRRRLGSSPGRRPADDEENE